MCFVVFLLLLHDDNETSYLKPDMQVETIQPLSILATDYMTDDIWDEEDSRIKD